MAQAATAITNVREIKRRINGISKLIMELGHRTLLRSFPFERFNFKRLNE
jgi:hypothetical protein